MVNYRIAPIKTGSDMWEASYLIWKYLKVVAPKRCQRPLCWNNPTKVKYFKSLLMNRVEGTFIFIDIESAFEAIQREYHSNEKSYQFFEDLLKQGYKYIVIDGNNRFHFLQDLFNDNWLIPQGEYQYIADVATGRIETFEVVNRRRKFSDLPSKVQKAIQSRKSPVSEYSQLDLAGLADVFTNVNSGVALNRQELRNVMDVDYADLVRELEEDIMPLLNQLMERPQIGLKGQEFIVDCLDFILNVKTDDFNDENEVINTTYSPITQSSKTKLYESDFPSAAVQVRIKDTFIDLASFIDQMIDEKITKEDKKLLKRKALLQNLFYMMYNGLTTYEQVQKAVELHDKAYFDKKNLFYPNWSDADTDKQFDDLTFKNACEGSRSVNMEFRCLQLTKIISEVMGTELSKAFNL